jgi:negative regulator of flagellin synthesis FlgM
MKIDSEQLLSTVNKFKNEPVEKNETAAAAVDKKSHPGAADRVELSTKGSEIQRLKSTMQATEDIRSDKVAQLKAQIDSGSYHVAGTAVAAKMLQSWSELNEK